MRQRSVTIIFVSHSMSDVKAIGDRTLWIHRGAMLEIGDTDLVVSKYMAAADTNGRRSTADVTRGLSAQSAHGGRIAEILEFSLADTTGAPALMLVPSTELVARIVVRALSEIARPRIGFVMRNHVGLDFASFDAEPGPMQSGQVLLVELHIDLPHLYPAHFSFSPYVSDAATESDTMCDWIDNALTLEVARGDRPVYGYIHVPCRVEVNARLHPHESRVHR
jgi:hypothetical protein